jgi:hypothetical protein
MGAILMPATYLAENKRFCQNSMPEWEKQNWRFLATFYNFVFWASQKVITLCATGF